MSKLNSISGNLDDNTKNNIVNDAIMNGSNDEVLTVDNQLNENDSGKDESGVEKSEMTEFRIINDQTKIRRNDSGFLVMDGSSNGKIKAGLVTKKYNLEDMSSKVDREIKNIK